MITMHHCSHSLHVSIRDNAIHPRVYGLADWKIIYASGSWCNANSRLQNTCMIIHVEKLAQDVTDTDREQS